MAKLDYDYSLLAHDDRFEVVARLAPAQIKRAANAPRLLRGRLGARQGVVRISGETCGGQTIIWTVQALP